MEPEIPTFDRSLRIRLSRWGAAAGVVALVGLAPCAVPPAGAEPMGPPPVPNTTGPMPDTPMTGPTPGPMPSDPGGWAAPRDDGSISLSDLGSSDTIWFDARSDITSNSVSFVVPKGLKPATLNTTVEVPVDLKFGYLTVTQDGQTLSRQPLPTKDQTRIRIPLDGLKVDGNWTSVTLTISAVPVTDAYCWDPNTPIRMVDSSISFAGNENAPTSVANFLSPALRRITIAVPRRLSPAESSAAIQLAAAMTTRYGWQRTSIEVVGLPEGSTSLPKPAPGERQIVIKEGPDPGLALQPNGGVPSLLITGQGDELTNQTRLLTDPSLAFALSSKAVAGPLTTDLRPAEDSVTLAQLKQKVYSADSLRPDATITLDQTVFAEPVADMRVHVLGSYTPLPSNFNGELIASVGDLILDRWPVDAEGTIDRWVDIPNQRVQRATGLKIRLHTVGDPGHCNDYLGPALRIDPETEIQVKRASPPLPPGFRSLPQALMPRVLIGLGPDTYNDTLRAARIVVGLQRTSSMPLITAVTSLKEATAAREPAILVSPAGWNDPSLTLPISSDMGKLSIAALDSNGDPTTLNLDPAIKFGSLQTVWNGQRTVLIATSNGDAAQLDELLRWLSADRGRWSNLEGRAVISVPGSDPVMVPNRPSDLPEAPKKKSTLTSMMNWAWWVAGGLAVLAIAGALVILRRAQQASKRTAVVVAAATDDPGIEAGDDAPRVADDEES